MVYQCLALAGVPGVTYIGNAGDPSSLELLTIELVNGSSQIGGALELDKATERQRHFEICIFSCGLPLAIAVAASLRVDDIKAGLTSKVLQVLDPDPCKLQIQGTRRMHIVAVSSAAWSGWLPG